MNAASPVLPVAASTSSERNSVPGAANALEPGALFHFLFTFLDKRCTSWKDCRKRRSAFARPWSRTAPTPGQQHLLRTSSRHFQRLSLCSFGPIHSPATPGLVRQIRKIVPQVFLFYADRVNQVRQIILGVSQREGRMGHVISSTRAHR